MFWILSLLVLVALQPHHGSAEEVVPELKAATGTFSSTTMLPTFSSASTSIETSTETSTTGTTGALTTGTTFAPPDKCKVDCSGAADNTQVADPLDCHKFYVCFDEDPMGPLDCPHGEYFNNSKNDCVPSEAEECEPICLPTTGGGCAYVCVDETSGLVADRFDCSSYYDCSKDKDTVLTCDDQTPFFDGESCQTDESKCCHCKPYCYDGDTGHMVIDPIDCTRYYLCTEDNKVPEYSGSCSAGNFDPFRGTCSTAAPCITLCTNVVNPEGCIDVFTCHEEGYFPACPSLCDPRNYLCTSHDICSTVTADTCTGDNVFNPDTSHCIAPSDCPYPPAGV